MFFQTSFVVEEFARTLGPEFVVEHDVELVVDDVASVADLGVVAFDVVSAVTV